MNCIPCLLRVILESKFSKIVGKTNKTYSKRSPCLCGYLCCLNWVVLIINQFIQSTNRKIAHLLQLFIRINLSNINGRKNTQSNLTIFIINMLKWISGESDLLTKITHLYLIFKGRVGVTVVDIHQI